MILDRSASRLADPGQSGSTNSFSRRSFIQAGAAGGGGILMSLSLPFVRGDAQAAGAGGFAPNAFVRVDGDGQIVLTMPYVEMGQGDYTGIFDADRRELEVDLKKIVLKTASPGWWVRIIKLAWA
jgi:isoquinoline 1-oxidoreductase subunit beta